MTFFGDTPAKALKDIQMPPAAAHVVKADAGRGGATPPVQPTMAQTAAKPDAVKPAVVQTAAKPDAQPAVVQASNAPPAAVPAAPARSRTPRTRSRPAPCWPRPARPSTPATSSRRTSSSTRRGRSKPDLQWFEDNPDKLLAEVARAEARTNPASSVVKSKDMTPAEVKAQAVALLKQGRGQLADNKLDDADPDVGPAAGDRPA